MSRLSYMYCRVPTCTREWLEIAKGFEERWNYPHVHEAIDGKHIVIQKHANSGSHYFNYKHTHSIVLLAVAGPNYECLYADIGANGRCNDGGIWSQCGLNAKLQEKEKDAFYTKMPYVFLGDDAFALSQYDEAIPSTRFICRKTYLQLSP